MVIFDLNTTVSFTIRNGSQTQTFAIPNARLRIRRATFAGYNNIIMPDPQFIFTNILEGGNVTVELRDATILVSNGFVIAGQVAVTSNSITYSGIADQQISYPSYSYSQVLKALVGDSTIVVVPGFILSDSTVKIYFGDIDIILQNPAVRLQQDSVFFPLTRTVIATPNAPATFLSRS